MLDAHIVYLPCNDRESHDLVRCFLPIHATLIAHEFEDQNRSLQYLVSTLSPHQTRTAFRQATKFCLQCVRTKGERRLPPSHSSPKASCRGNESKQISEHGIPGVAYGK